MKQTYLIIAIAVLLALGVYYFTNTKAGLKQRFYHNIKIGKYPNMRPTDITVELDEWVDSHTVLQLKTLVNTGRSELAS